MTILITDNQVIVNYTITTTGDIMTFPVVMGRWQISNDGSNPLRVYRRQTDFDNNANFITLAASTGFFEGPHHSRSIWLRATGGNATGTISVYPLDGMPI